MNNLDLFRWIGGIPVILELLADEPLFAWVAAAVGVMAAFRLFCLLYRGDRA